MVLVPNASRPFNFVQLFQASSLHVCYHNALSLPDMSLKREPTIERDNNLPILTDVFICYYSKSLALNLALFPGRGSYVHIPLKQHAIYFLNNTTINPHAGPCSLLPPANRDAFTAHRKNFHHFSPRFPAPSQCLENPYFAPQTLFKLPRCAPRAEAFAPDLTVYFHP